MNGFGEFLYTLRKEKGMTQAELAQTLGVTNKAVSKWETGEAMPETAQLLPISRIFGVTVDELLSGRREERQNGMGDGEIDERAAEEYLKKHLFTRGKDDGPKTLSDKIGGGICLAIVVASVIAYLSVGGFLGIWHPYWVIIPSAALTCGVVGIIFDLCNGEKRRAKTARNENPYTGALCGGIVLVAIIVYLNLGAFWGLWHPYWIILVIAACCCAIIGAAAEIIAYRKKK